MKQIFEPPKVGDIVEFSDANATVSDGKPVKRRGTVNGPALGGAVPVWSERDNGREPTTIIVAVQDIVAVYRREVL